MVLYIFITLFTVGLGSFVNGAYRRKLNISNGTKYNTFTPNRQELLNKASLFGIFMTLTTLSIIRVGTGNDYWVYRDNLLKIAGGHSEVSYELGFRYLVKLIQMCFGLDSFRVTFAVMAIVTVGFSLKAIYDTSDWFAYSFFLFMANGFYFMSFSNMRYYLALAIAIYAMKYIFENKLPGFILWICVAALFHKTILLVIPVYLVAYYLKWSKKTIWLLPVGSLLLFFGKHIIRFLIFKIYPYYEGDLLYDNGRISWINILKCMAILVMCLMFYKDSVRNNKKAEMLFNLNLFALMIYSFASYVPEVTRICYYMVVGQIFLIPEVFKGIKNKRLRNFFIVAVAIAYVGYFAMFLWQGRNDGIRILPYMTWIFI